MKKPFENDPLKKHFRKIKNDMPKAPQDELHQILRQVQTFEPSRFKRFFLPIFAPAFTAFLLFIFFSTSDFTSNTNENFITQMEIDFSNEDNSNSEETFGEDWIAFLDEVND